MEKVLKDLVNFENALLDCVDNRYDKDDQLEVEREVTLRRTMYTALVKLRESIYDEAVQIKDDQFETKKKIEELTIEKERLEKEVDKLRARVNNPDPFMIRVDGLGSDPDANWYKIRATELYLNGVLRIKGFVTLSDVYKEFGLDEPANSNMSKVCGWDNTTSDAIRFEIYKHETKNSFIVVADDYRPIL